MTGQARLGNHIMNAPPADVLELFKSAFQTDNAVEVSRLLSAEPAIKSRINDPIGAFDAPAILSVRSRAMLDVLLDAGADIDAKSQWWAGGFGLLHTADPALAAYAIERGATVDVHAAARLGLCQKLRELVSADPALVHARGGDGQTPLHFASTIEIVDYLLDHGADIDALDVDHVSTPAQYMVADRQPLVRRLIERGCKTDILMATAIGDLQLVQRILNDSPDSIHTRVSDEYFAMIGSKNGGTIYQWTLGWYVSAHQVARKFHHDQVLQLLMDRSPPTVQLLDACWSADEARVRRLLKANPGIEGDFLQVDRRQIAHAARNNEPDVVRLMFECGLPVAATSQHRGTALHWAGFHGNREMTDMILRHHPELEVLDADFSGTPVNWTVYGSEHGWNCKSGDYPATLEALLAAGAKLPTKISGSSEVRAVLHRHGMTEDAT